MKSSDCKDTTFFEILSVPCRKNHIIYICKGTKEMKATAELQKATHVCRSTMPDTQASRPRQDHNY